jgi:hypothetical protein
MPPLDLSLFVLLCLAAMLGATAYFNRGGISALWFDWSSRRRR